MARSKINTFIGRDGLFHCITLDGARVFGPFNSEREVRAAKRLMLDHEHGCESAERALKPQPAADRDINPLTR